MLCLPPRTVTRVPDIAPVHTQATTQTTQVLRDDKNNNNFRIRKYGKQFIEHISGFFTNHEIEPFCDIAKEDEEEEEEEEDPFRFAHVCARVAASIWKSCVCRLSVCLCRWLNGAS